jgi:hypothetical protein
MPDIFGNPTPAEQQMAVQAAFRQKQKDFMESNMAASPGAQAGQALANIFAPWVKKTLDTSRARKAEVSRLLQQDSSLTEEEAKELAKERIKPQYAEVRRAERLQKTTQDFTKVQKELTESGAPEAVVEVASRLEIANRLIDQGFVQEGQQLRQQAVELRKAEELRLAELDDLKAGTERKRSETFRQELENYTDTDLYVNMGALKAGKPLNEVYQDVRLMDTETRDRLDTDPNWIKAGNFLKAQLTGDEALARRPVPPGVQENIISQISMLGSLGAMREAIPYAGVDGVFPTGFWNKFAGTLGFGDDVVIDAVAVEQKMAADIQSIIKGIPSNYDASVFEKMIPRLGAVKSRRVYEAKIDLLENHTRSALELTIGFYKGTNQEVPQQIVAAAAAVGVDTRGVEAWSGDQIERKDEIFKAHQEEGRKQVNAIEEEEDKPTGIVVGTPVLVPAGQQ